jgi:hypothetical protein
MMGPGLEILHSAKFELSYFPGLNPEREVPKTGFGMRWPRRPHNLGLYQVHMEGLWRLASSPSAASGYQKNCLKNDELIAAVTNAA